MSGADIAAEVAAALVEAGQAAGDGIGAVAVTIRKAGTATGPEWDQTAGTPTDHTAKAIPASVEEAQKRGMAVEASERVYSVVNHGLTIAPTVADKMRIGAEVDAASAALFLPIIGVVAEDAAGYPILWLVKVAR